MKEMSTFCKSEQQKKEFFDTNLIPHNFGVLVQAKAPLGYSVLGNLTHFLPSLFLFLFLLSFLFSIFIFINNFELSK